MKILIGADIVPTKSNQSIFESGQMEKVVDEPLRKLLAEADYRILNLECPLTDIESPITKCGPNLLASTASVKGLKALGIDFLTLANNHILDQGEQGLRSTIKVIKEAGISYAGVGENLQEAQQPYIFTLGNKRVGIYCCAEHEFSIADKNKPGANPFEPLDSFDNIAELKRQCDYVVCLYHGGKEYFRYPSPYLQRVCRKLVEKGADLVVCQHSHCIGSKEDYHGGTIVYGQGNFLFDHGDNEFRNTSLLISVDFENSEVSYIPIIKAGNGIKLAQGAEEKEILDVFYHRSAEILEEGFVEAEYSKFAKSMLVGYIATNSWFYKNIFFRGINKLSGNRLKEWMAKKDIKRFWTSILNHYECEAHREVIMRGLRGKSYK